MPVPALIIGLGGTGTWVATYVKKELLELEGNPFNQVKIVAFDTVSQAEASVGGSGQLRGRGQSTGAVRLGTGEYFYTGGNVQSLMREVANGKHSHLGSWLLADFYLQTLADKTFNLNEGAGQFRQFGRLAVFRDVAAPSLSIIYGTLQDALVKLKRNNPTATSVQVFIVGSLAGGTGAGMFTDIAHMVREIAAQPNVDMKGKMTIRGYLVLPDAFSRTVDQAWLQSMYARAYAGMRESRRFTVSFDYEQGYPMHYHENSTHPLWGGVIKGKLFDLLYFLDGQGAQSKISAASLSNGVAPAIADAISAAIDGQAGPHFSAYVANIEAERTQRIASGRLSKNTATYGSLGTYSIVFPIYHIVETWTHSLGLDLLNRLLAPTEFDGRSGLPTNLAVDANQEETSGMDGRTAGFDFLQANRPILYQYRDEGGNLQSEQIEPTLLPGELARIAREASRPNSSIVQILINRQISDWEPAFHPEASDKETLRLKQRVKGILETRLYTPNPGQIQGRVLASDQQPQQKEDPVQGSERILQEVRTFKNQYLGNEDPRTGQRMGGAYRNALGQITNYQVGRFGLLLDRQMQTILNGQPNNTALVARGGKPGFLKHFLGGLFDALEIARDTLQRVQQIRRERGDNRRNALATAQTAAQAMSANADKKTFLGKPAKEAYQAQHRYLEAESRLIDLLQVEATEDAILQTVYRMIDYVLSAQESLQAWEQALCRQRDSLYGKLLLGKGLINSDRQSARDVAVRHIVTDDTYEEARYEAYLGRVDDGWLNRLLGNVAWGMEHKIVSGQPKAHFTLTMAGKTLLLDRAEDNAELWLDECRRPFADAWKEESVISYLLAHQDLRDPTKLGEMIYARGGALLAFEGGEPLPANFLRAYFQTSEEAGHTDYLRKVVQFLAEKSGQSTTEEVKDDATGAIRTQESRFVRFLNSEDRFKLTLVFTQELIELDRITSYAHNGSGAYLGFKDRRLLHVFPAEVNAATYETRLPELRQQVRLFSDEVTLQLEKLAQFELFLMCYAYDLIRREGMKDESGNQRNLWKLFLPPAGQFTADGSEARTEEIWLTSPYRLPLILDALTTFNYVGLDARRETSNYTVEIPYDQVRRALRRVREEDAQRRISEGTAGNGNQGLLAQVKMLAEPGQEALLPELARIDRVREMQTYLEQRVLPAYQKNLGHPDNQKDYDVASIFVLMLRDEVAAVRRTVEDGIRSLQGIGQPKLEPDTTETDERLNLL